MILKHPATRTRAPAFGAGFTLLEVLVSTVILSILVLILIGMSDGASRLWRDGEHRRESLTEGMGGLQIISDDLRSAVVTSNPDTLIIESQSPEEPRLLRNKSSVPVTASSFLFRIPLSTVNRTHPVISALSVILLPRNPRRKGVITSTASTLRVGKSGRPSEADHFVSFMKKPLPRTASAPSYWQETSSACNFHRWIMNVTATLPKPFASRLKRSTAIQHALSPTIPRQRKITTGSFFGISRSSQRLFTCRR